MRPQFKIGYLVTGMVFVGLSLRWLLRHLDVIDDARWFLPAVLLVAGLIGLTVSLSGSVWSRHAAGRSGAPADDESTVPPTSEGPSS